jgi:preprotein translocase subunit SecE
MGSNDLTMNMNPVEWINEARTFLDEVRGEYKKVTFPTQKEAVAGTIGVLVIVAVITAALSLVDLVLGQAIQLVVP